MSIECKKCGDCCRKYHLIVPLSDEQAEMLHIWFGNPLDEEPSMVLSFGVPSPCAYLKDNLCTIYESRPQSCRKYKCEKSS